MIEPRKGSHSGKGPGIRFKIVILTCIITVLICAVFAFYSYSILRKMMVLNLGGEARHFLKLASDKIDRQALKKISQKILKIGAADRTSEIEKSGDLALLSNQLVQIQALEAVPISRLSIIFLTSDGSPVTIPIALLPDKSQGQSSPADRAPAHGSVPAPPSDMGLIERAVGERTMLIDSRLSWGNILNPAVIRAYEPIFNLDKGSPLGLICIDLYDSGSMAAMKKGLILFAIIIGSALFFAFIASFIIGSILRLRIMKIAKRAHDFAENGTLRETHITIRDELGALDQNLASMANAIISTQGKKDSMLKVYGRFVPHELLALIRKKKLADTGDIEAAERPMAVLFANAWSFTTLSEGMSPQETISLLNTIIGSLGPAIREHGGIICRYSGDSVMAIFPQGADDAIKGAIDIQKRIRKYNDGQESGRAPVRLGVGIHFGKLILGTILEQDKMEVMVISEAVTLASKLERLTRKYFSNIIVSGQILKETGSLSDYHYRFLDRLSVKDRIEPVTIYEVYNADEPAQVELKTRAKKDFEEAIKLYFATRFQDALKILGEISERNPKDRACELYINRCEYFIAHGVSDSWKGLEKLQ